MYSGVHRKLYDGPVSAEDLQMLKPHASCYGEGCDKVIQEAEEDELWHIIRGKPNCHACFKKKEDRKEAKRAGEADKETKSAAIVDEISCGLVNSETTNQQLLLWDDSPKEELTLEEIEIDRTIGLAWANSSSWGHQAPPDGEHWHGFS